MGRNLVDNQPSKPTSSLVRNTFWSLLGYTLPFPAALVAIPLLTRALGTDRFGLLSLAWALIGSSSIFDLGLGRALTKVIAERLETDDTDLPPLVSSTLLLLVLVGAVSAGLVFATAPILIDSVFKVPESLRHESLQAFRIVALSIPLITLSAGMRGILEAHEKFRIVGVMNSLVWSLMFLAPLAALPFSHSLVVVMLALLVSRLFAAGIYAWLCTSTMPEMRSAGLPRLGSAGPALKFGGWLTVSNVVGPFLTYFDRFVIGTLLSVGAVAFYTVPYDMIVRMSVFASAVTSVLFPTFSSSFGRDRERTDHAYRWGLRTIIVAVTPFALGVVLLAPEGLTLWLGPDFADQSTTLLRWLTVGVFISCLVQVPYSLIQAAGRPDLTARLHVLELVPYLLTLWLFVSKAGITGAALAWTLRVTVDGLLLMFIASRLYPESLHLARRVVTLIVLAWIVGWLLQGDTSLRMRMGLLVVLAAFYLPIVWQYALTSQEKARIMSVPGVLRNRASKQF